MTTPPATGAQSPEATHEIEDLPLLLRVEEAAKVLRISRGTAYANITSGAIPSVRIGRSLRIPRHALAKLLRGDDDSA